jgi:hypothetical protein
MAGVLIALFTVEQIANGLRNGFEHDEPEEAEAAGAFEVPGPGGLR